MTDYFVVRITDSIRENKRTARWMEFVVPASNRQDAIAVLRRESPTSFMYVKAIEVEPFTPRCRLLANGYLDREAAERVYERTGGNLAMTTVAALESNNGS